MLVEIQQLPICSRALREEHAPLTFCWVPAINDRVHDLGPIAGGFRNVQDAKDSVTEHYPGEHEFSVIRSASSSRRGQRKSRKSRS